MIGDVLGLVNPSRKRVESASPLVPPVTLAPPLREFIRENPPWLPMLLLLPLPSEV